MVWRQRSGNAPNRPKVTEIRVFCIWPSNVKRLNFAMYRRKTRIMRIYGRNIFDSTPDLTFIFEKNRFFFRTFWFFSLDLWSGYWHKSVWLPKISAISAARRLKLARRSHWPFVGTARYARFFSRLSSFRVIPWYVNGNSKWSDRGEIFKSR